jgi:hypothetical protein
MIILTYIWNNISKFAVAFLGLFTYYTYNRNKELNLEKEVLIKADNCNKKLIEVQKKVINVTKDYKPSSLDDNIKRMRNNKL